MALELSIMETQYFERKGKIGQAKRWNNFGANLGAVCVACF